MKYISGEVTFSVHVATEGRLGLQASTGNSCKHASTGERPISLSSSFLASFSRHIEE
ncbi:hypothetical protein SK128_023398, partial [Halocaridina rubra]